MLLTLRGTWRVFSAIFLIHRKYFQEHLNFKKGQHTVGVSRDHKKEVLKHMITGFALPRIFQKEGSLVCNDDCSKLKVVSLKIKRNLFFCFLNAFLSEEF